MTTAIAKPLNQLVDVSEFDRIAEECRAAISACAGKMQRAIAVASAIGQIESAISDDMMDGVMALQNSSLGFQTDKQETGYQLQIVRRCFIEATLRGVMMTNNEMNIIAGRCYITRNGFERLVREFPGLSDLKLRPGVPQLVGDAGALMPYRASWKLNGAEREMVCEKTMTGDERLCVRVNKGMGADAIIGKATRKILARIHSDLIGTGEVLPEGDVEDSLPTNSGNRSPVTDAVRSLGKNSSRPPKLDEGEATPEELAEMAKGKSSDALFDKAPNAGQ